MNPHLTQGNIICLRREREIKELVQSKPEIEEGSSLPSFKVWEKKWDHVALCLRLSLVLGMPSDWWLAVWLLQKTAVLCLLCINTGAYLVSPGAGPGTMTQCSPALACRKQWLGMRKGTTPFCSTQPLPRLNGVQGVTQNKVSAFHVTCMQQRRTQRFVSMLSLQWRQTPSNNSKRSFPHWESWRKLQHSLLYILDSNNCHLKSFIQISYKNTYTTHKASIIILWAVGFQSISASESLTARERQHII